MSDRISSSTPDKRLEKARDFVWGHTDIAHEEALKALHLLRERRLDFGDLFFQRGVSEHFALNDGIIKTCSYNIGRGVGVRAVTGGKSGFAYSHELTPEALYAACRAARSINSDPGVPGINVTPSELAAPPLYSEDDPLGDLSRERKVELLNTLDRLARAADPRVIQVMAGLSCAHQAKVIYTTEEHICCDIKPVVSLTLNVIMEQNGRRESGHASLGGACLLSTLIDGQTCARLVAEACRIATVNLEARPAPGGTLTVVLGAGWPGVLVHEAVGHGLEGDFIRTGSSLFAGRLGEQVASPSCTIIDDGTIPDRRGSVSVDDEGTAPQHNVLIEKGILKGFMYDRQNAALMHTAPTGNGRRESYLCTPQPRMTNTYLAPGEYAPEEILESVKHGIYAVDFRGGQVDIVSGKFVFSTSEAYLIENGKVTSPVRGVTLMGNGPETMRQVSMVGNDLAFDRGIGMCGKGGQGVPVGIGLPTVRLDAVTVGGSEVG